MHLWRFQGASATALELGEALSSASFVLHTICLHAFNQRLLEHDWSIARVTETRTLTIPVSVFIEITHQQAEAKHAKKSHYKILLSLSMYFYY